LLDFVELAAAADEVCRISREMMAGGDRPRGLTLGQPRQDFSFALFSRHFLPCGEERT
jgi:hypothetical protein